MPHIAKMGTKNRIVVPPEIVEALGIKTGDYVLFEDPKDGRSSIGLARIIPAVRK